jgi:pimeloyl-ACP methyl ester carboxylesterase
MRKKFYHIRRFKRCLISFLARRWRIFSPLLRARAPLQVRHYASEKHSQELLIFLPGLGDVLDEYELRGFIDAVRQSAVPFDMTVADMDLGYYISRTSIQRLREDIIVPARANGHQRISLAGISLGGFGALYYAMHHPDDIARLFLLAPYLGDKRIIAEIAQAGGAKNWISDSILEHDDPRKLWQSLKRLANEASDLSFANFYLAYGLQDNFAAGNKLLADLLPPGHVYTVHGKHDWRTWSSLWNMLLAQSKDIFS